MQLYLSQLLEDLKEAKTRKPSPRNMELPEEMECLRDVIELEQQMAEDDNQTMESIFGVPQYYFPPADKLTDEQLEQLTEAILDLWKAYNYEADLPENLPARFAYPLLVACWKKTFPLLTGTNGTWHLEFCHYEPEECPFPSEYCRCKDF